MSDGRRRELLGLRDPEISVGIGVGRPPLKRTVPTLPRAWTDPVWWNELLELAAHASVPSSLFASLSAADSASPCADRAGELDGFVSAS